MNDWIALIGSITIGGLFMLSVMRFYGGVIEHSQETTFELITQENAVDLLEIIESDFRKMGSGLVVAQPPVISNPDSSDITFWADVDEDGDAETVRYYTEAPLSANAPPNPDAVILYRVIDGANTISSVAGVTVFSVEPRDILGNTPTDPSEIRMIDLNVRIESLYDYDGEFATVVFNKRFTPQNLIKPSDLDFDGGGGGGEDD